MAYDPQAETTRRIRAIALVVGAAMLLALIYLIYTNVSRSGKVPVEVFVLPDYAKITANGKGIPHGTAYLKEGEYTIRVTANGFETLEKKLKITATDNHINLAPLPNTVEGKAWAAKHIDDYDEYESVFAKNQATEGKSFKDANPIVRHLPYRDPYYTIGYRQTVNDEVIVTITTPSPRYRYSAIKQIQAWGIDPGDLTIEFINYRNPLGN